MMKPGHVQKAQVTDWSNSGIYAVPYAGESPSELSVPTRNMPTINNVAFVFFHVTSNAGAARFYTTTVTATALPSNPVTT
jgi:hypothetical protein